MNLQQLIKKFTESPYLMEMGAGILSKRFKCSKKLIYETKNAVRLKSKPTSPKYVGSEKLGESEIKRFETSKPLSPKEIEELANVDNINTYVARVWDKLGKNGIWTYSIDIRYRIENFYTKDELRVKLKELFPTNFKPYTLPSPKNPSKKALIVLLSDEHVGAINVTNIYSSSKLSYSEKLKIIFNEILALNQTFEELYLISLGDQLNGWDSKTTRKGHEVMSLSNKEQFDIYCSARVEFYNDLFSSGVAESYNVFDVENSNHSGLGFSYMANQYLDMYLQSRFPEVTRVSLLDAIDGVEYGNHLILMGHGKDEKFQKRPLPAVLNAQTDLMLCDYIMSKSYSPYTKSVTFYKGDLHLNGVQNGKFGRYVNVQSMIGNTDYGDINYGNTKGGALLEILDKNSYRVSSQPVWF